MNYFEIFYNEIKSKKIKHKFIIEKLNCSRQNYYKHVNNLKNNRVSFDFEQLKILKMNFGINFLE